MDRFTADRPFHLAYIDGKPFVMNGTEVVKPAADAIAAYSEANRLNYEHGQTIRTDYRTVTPRKAHRIRRYR